MRQVIVKGAAVHTRGVEAGKDYAWHIKVGEMGLLDKIISFHRQVLRDIGGETLRLLTLVEDKRVGFLIGDMPTSRADHGKRTIYDTLYLELDEKYIPIIFKAVAILLLCTHDKYQQHEVPFVEYAEKLFEEGDNERFTSRLIKMPTAGKQPDMDLDALILGKWALYSNETNQARCARFLTDYAKHYINNFCFISTGRVSLEKCQLVAECVEECVLLTLSSEVKEDIDLNKKTLKQTLKLGKLSNLKGLMSGLKK